MLLATERKFEMEKYTKTDETPLLMKQQGSIKHKHRKIWFSGSDYLSTLKPIIHLIVIISSTTSTLATECPSDASYYVTGNGELTPHSLALKQEPFQDPKYLGSSFSSNNLDSCGEDADCVSGVCELESGSCQCPFSSGYTLDYDLVACSEDLDECACDSLNDCDLTTTNCTNEVGNYTCTCLDGYQQQTNSMFECDIDECANLDMCGRHGRCLNREGYFFCSCDDGYAVDENDPLNTCIDEDECEVECRDEGHLCVNSEGGYTCGCQQGWEDIYADIPNLTLVICRDVDECVESNTSLCVSEDPNSECVNTKGSYNCSCISGYQLNNHTGLCSDIDECEELCLEDEGVCENTNGSFICSCKNGEAFNTSSLSCPQQTTTPEPSTSGEAISTIMSSSLSSQVQTFTNSLTSMGPTGDPMASTTSLGSSAGKTDHFVEETTDSITTMHQTHTDSSANHLTTSLSTEASTEQETTQTSEDGSTNIFTTSITSTTDFAYKIFAKATLLALINGLTKLIIS